MEEIQRLLGEVEKYLKEIGAPTDCLSGLKEADEQSAIGEWRRLNKRIDTIIATGKHNMFVDTIEALFKSLGSVTRQIKLGIGEEDKEIYDDLVGQLNKINTMISDCKYSSAASYLSTLKLNLLDKYSVLFDKVESSVLNEMYNIILELLQKTRDHISYMRAPDPKCVTEFKEACNSRFRTPTTMTAIGNDVQEKVCKIEETTRVFNSEISEYDRQIAELEAKLSKLDDTRIEEIAKLIPEKTNKIVKQVKKLTAENKSLTAKVKRMEGKLDELLAPYRKELQEIEEKMLYESKTLAERKAAQTEKEEELAKLNSEYEKLTGEHNSTEAELDKAIDNNKGIEKENASMLKEHRVSELKNDKYRSYIQEITTVMHKVEESGTAKIDRLKEMKTKKAEEIEKTKTETESLMFSVKSLREEEIPDKQYEYQVAKDELDHMIATYRAAYNKARLKRNHALYDEITGYMKSVYSAIAV